jgi:hypothetical protein
LKLAVPTRRSVTPRAAAVKTGQHAGQSAGSALPGHACALTSFFGSATVTGYSIGGLVRLYGWTIAGNV